MTSPADKAWIVQQRTDKLLAQTPAPAAPTFFPSTADAVAAATPPGPVVTPEQQRKAADLLLGTATRTSSAGWPPTPAVTPPATSGRTHFNLPMQTKTGPGWGTRPAPDPIADGLRNRLTQGIGDAAGAGIEALYTASSYLNWVKTARYPWFWGPIRGLADVEHMLNATHHAYMSARHLTPYTKQLASDNLSKAMLWVREQRAQQAARSGGTPVPF